MLHVGDMDQVQDVVPVHIAGLFHHLCRVLQCLFHHLQMQDSLTDQAFLQFQGMGDILRIIINGHGHDLLQRKSQVF